MLEEARGDVVYDPRNPRHAREAGRPIVKALAIVLWYGVALMILGYGLFGMPAS